MGKRCVYCSECIGEDSVVDMCQKCMYQVWGEKMAKAIVESMEKEKRKGNMELGRVSEVDEKEFIEKEPVVEKVAERRFMDEIREAETLPVEKADEEVKESIELIGAEEVPGVGSSEMILSEI